MNHRHLVLAYVITWVIQLSYAGLLVRNWLHLKKLEREFPAYTDSSE